MERARVERAAELFSHLGMESTYKQKPSMGRTCSVTPVMLALAILPVALAQGGGNVLPAGAHPLGYTLTEMADKLEAFVTSGETLPVPSTPFQILYLNPATVQTLSIACPYGGTGVIYIDSNPFTVPPGTKFW